MDALNLGPRARCPGCGARILPNQKTCVDCRPETRPCSGCGKEIKFEAGHLCSHCRLTTKVPVVKTRQEPVDFRAWEKIAIIFFERWGGRPWSYPTYAAEALITVPEAIRRVNKLIEGGAVVSVGPLSFSWLPPKNRLDPLFGTADEKAQAFGRRAAKKRWGGREG